jgi:uncharacterized membrane protein YkvA (DUF1232 family)
MSMRVTFELEDKDLRYFRANMKKAQAVTSKLSQEDVLASAEAMVKQVKTTKMPTFVAVRLRKLGALIEMVRDEEWALADDERKNVLGALAYFADPEDIIPDSVPVLGFIDDAIMIELLVTELTHEIEAFADFCRFRKEEKARNRSPNITRAQFLEAKRHHLHGRMRRRTSAASRLPSGRARVRLF